VTITWAGVSIGRGMPHPSSRTLLHPAVLMLPHEQKMSYSMTEPIPVFLDPVATAGGGTYSAWPYSE